MLKEEKSARILGLDQSLKACGKCTDTDRFFSQIRSKLFCSSLDNAEHIDKFILAAAEKQFSIADISDIVSSAFQIAGDMGREQYTVFSILNILRENLQQFISGNRIEAAGGFVQDQQLCVVRERTGQHQLHLHPL